MGREGIGIVEDWDRMMETEMEMMTRMGEQRKSEWKDIVVGSREGGRCEDCMRREQCVMYSRITSTTKSHNIVQRDL
jgi:hypothetical protein